MSLTKTVNIQEKPQVIKIKNNIKHPDFRSTSKYDDIALIELEQEVDVTDGFARPMCLPTSKSKSATDKYSIAGWGFLNRTTVRRYNILKFNLYLNTKRNIYLFS